MKAGVLKREWCLGLVAGLCSCAIEDMQEVRSPDNHVLAELAGLDGEHYGGAALSVFYDGTRDLGIETNLQKYAGNLKFKSVTEARPVEDDTKLLAGYPGEYVVMARGSSGEAVELSGMHGYQCGDNNLVRNVRFENIRVENFREGSLFNLRNFYNKKYCTASGRGVEDITFKDVSYNGNRAELSIVEGYDEERKIRNVRFENLRINGQLITDDMPGKPDWYDTGDMAGIYVGPHVEDVTFVSTGRVQ